MSDFEHLPFHLLKAAFWHREEAAWQKPDVLTVIDELTRLGQAVDNVEVWLPTERGPRIPTPYIYTWSSDDKTWSETWSQFVARTNASAKQYITEFTWDQRDTANLEQVPFFNIEVSEDDTSDSRIYSGDGN